MSEISDMIHIYRLGAEGSYFLIKGSVQLVLFLLQQYKKMQRANLISRGEVKDFEKFLTATEGRFQLLNIPTEDGKQLEEMKKDLDRLGISYTILPDLNVGDKVTTIAYYIDHTPQMEGWYRQFCTSQLTGGAMEYERLQRLTEGQVSIVNLPWEADTLEVGDEPTRAEEQTHPQKKLEKEIEQTDPVNGQPLEVAKENGKTIEEIKKEQKEKLEKRMERRQEKLEKLMEDLQALRINFTILPDLNVGDGNIQIAYASADAPQMRIWFENYQEQLVKEGKVAGPMQEMNLDGYMDSGKTDAKAYADRYPKEMRALMERGQDRPIDPRTEPQKKEEKPDFFQEQERQLLSQPAKGRGLTADAFKDPTAQKPGTQVLSIAAENVIPVDDTTVLLKNPGSKEEYLAIPMSEVHQMEDQRTYLVELEKAKEYLLFQRDGNFWGKRTGEDLKNWDQSDKKEVLPKMAAKKRTGAAPRKKGK